jgi:hypothetical protein
MMKKYSQLLVDIESGSAVDAIEAAKIITDKKLRQAEIQQLAYIAVNGLELHNKEAATYALSWIENKKTALIILINLLNSLENHESIRGQAAEGIGIIKPTNRNKLRMVAEDILIKCLKDSSPTVRFWSCYAVGRLKLRKAIPLLKKMTANDHDVCPGWWYVSEEAEDAIEWINGHNGKERIALLDRKNTEQTNSLDPRSTGR